MAVSDSEIHTAEGWAQQAMYDGASSGTSRLTLAPGPGDATLTRDDFAGDVPLVSVFRGEYVNSVHRGVVAVVDAGGEEVTALGDSAQPVFLRSAAKPF